MFKIGMLAKITKAVSSNNTDELLNLAAESLLTNGTKSVIIEEINGKVLLKNYEFSILKTLEKQQQLIKELKQIIENNGR